MDPRSANDKAFVDIAKIGWDRRRSPTSSAVRPQTAEIRRDRQHLRRRFPLEPKRSDTQGIVSLGEPHPVLVCHESAVIKTRSGPMECAKKKELAKGRSDEIGSPDDFGDAEVQVVDDARELVAG